MSKYYVSSVNAADMNPFPECVSHLVDLDSEAAIAFDPLVVSADDWGMTRLSSWCAKADGVLEPHEMYLKLIPAIVNKYNLVRTTPTFLAELFNILLGMRAVQDDYMYPNAWMFDSSVYSLALATSRN